MAFGQPSGPPATAKQVDELLSLLHDAGHSDFRDARGPMGFTQRQAGGRFTREEAESFIARLQGSASEDAPTVVGAPEPATPPRRTARQRMLEELPADQLAEELRRRGWSVTAP